MKLNERIALRYVQIMSGLIQEVVWRVKGLKTELRRVEDGGYIWLMVDFQYLATLNNA